MQCVGEVGSSPHSLATRIPAVKPLQAPGAHRSSPRAAGSFNSLTHQTAQHGCLGVEDESCSSRKQLKTKPVGILLKSSPPPKRQQCSQALQGHVWQLPGCWGLCTSVPAHICWHLSDATSAFLPGDLLNEAKRSWVSNPPGSAWIGMGKPACSKNPGQLENPSFFLRALFLLLFCRHGKELHGQSHTPGKDTHGSCSPRVQGGYNHGRGPGRRLEPAEGPRVAATRLRQPQSALGPPQPQGRAGSSSHQHHQPLTGRPQQGEQSPALLWQALSLGKP